MYDNHADASAVRVGGGALLSCVDPTLHKDAREEMRRVREAQQRRWSEEAAKAAEELKARQRARKLEKHKEDKKASRSMGGPGGE